MFKPWWLPANSYPQYPANDAQNTPPKTSYLGPPERIFKVWELWLGQDFSIYESIQSNFKTNCFFYIQKYGKLCTRTNSLVRIVWILIFDGDTESLIVK